MNESTASRRPGRFLAALPLLLAAAAIQAGEPESKLVLFDGRSLDGWARTDFYKPGDVTIDDGAIVMAVGNPMTGITSTRKDLPRTDYELTYEAKRITGSDFFAAATFPVGDSFASFINGGWGGSVTGVSSLDGADASENETGQAHNFENGRWYRFRIRVTGKALRCSIDGKELVAVNIEGRQVSTRIEVNRNKPLGFATYQTAGAVRKIEMRPLTPEEIEQSNRIED